MSVTNGQAASAATFNAAFLSRDSRHGYNRKP